MTATARSEIFRTPDGRFFGTQGEADTHQIRQAIVSFPQAVLAGVMIACCAVGVLAVAVGASGWAP